MKAVFRDRSLRRFIFPAALVFITSVLCSLVMAGICSECGFDSESDENCENCEKYNEAIKRISSTIDATAQENNITLASNEGSLENKDAELLQELYKLETDIGNSYDEVLEQYRPSIYSPSFYAKLLIPVLRKIHPEIILNTGRFTHCSAIVLAMHTGSQEEDKRTQQHVLLHILHFLLQMSMKDDFPQDSSTLCEALKIKMPLSKKFSAYWFEANNTELYCKDSDTFTSRIKAQLENNGFHIFRLEEDITNLVIVVRSPSRGDDQPVVDNYFFCLPPLVFSVNEGDNALSPDNIRSVITMGLPPDIFAAL